MHHRRSERGGVERKVDARRKKDDVLVIALGIEPADLVEDARTGHRALYYGWISRKVVPNSRTGPAGSATERDDASSIAIGPGGGFPKVAGGVHPLGSLPPEVCANCTTMPSACFGWRNAVFQASYESS